MMETVTKLIDGFSDIVRAFILVLFGTMMIFVGLMLATSGRYEAAFPLALGALSLAQVPRLMINLYRDFTGNY